MDLYLYQKIFDNIKSPVIISSPQSLIDCNKSLLDMLKINGLQEAQKYPSLRQLVAEILNEGESTQYKSIQDFKGNTLLLEVSLSPISEIDKIHLIEFKSVDDQSLYDEITFVSAHNRELFNNSPDAIVILDSIGKIVDINNSFSHLFGYTRIESIGRSIDSLVVPVDRRKEAKELFQRVLKQERVEITVQRQTKDHKIIDVHVVAYPVIIDKRITGNYVIYKDITQARQTEKLLLEKEEFLEQLFNRSLFPTAILDENEIVLDINAKFEEFFGYTRSESISNHINQLVVPQEFDKEATEFKSIIMNNKTMMSKTKRRHKNGSLLDVEAVGCPVLIGGRVQGFFAMYRDVSVEEEALSSLKVLLNTDPLTGLYSRKFIYEEISHRLEPLQIKQRTQQSFALVYADLDQFKQVNDTYGHETGDLLLIAVANRLQRSLGPDAYVSRIGGDEFLTLLDNLSPVQLEQKLDTLRAYLSESCNIGGHQLNTRASLGVAFYPEDGKTVDDLISFADGKMYEEKKAQRILRNPIRVEPILPIE